jgi:hypothetical protein
VISLRIVAAAMTGDRVAFDNHGTVLEIPLPGAGPAILLVSEVTDAVKRVVGDRVVASVDRREAWMVEGMVLHRQVLDRLDGETLSTVDLLEAVRAAGFAWEVSPMTSVP